MRNLRIDFSIEPIDIFQRFAVIDAQVFTHCFNGWLGIVLHHVDAFDDRAQISGSNFRLRL
jgi:hypothetical protein